MDISTILAGLAKIEDEFPGAILSLQANPRQIAIQISGVVAGASILEIILDTETLTGAIPDMINEARGALRCHVEDQDNAAL